METLEKVLEYQKIDVELRKVLDEIERSDDQKKLEQAKTEFNNAKSTVTETEKVAENIISFYNNAAAFLEESEAKIAEIADKMTKTDDMEAQRALAAELEKVREKMADVEKRLGERADKSEKVIHAYLDGQTRGKKMRAAYDSIKERLNKFKKEKEPHINELKAKLDAIRPAIAPDVLQTYETITAERKYPAFVEARPTENKNFRCFCGLELSQKAKSELLDKGCVRCETCRRLLYKK
ncbi:MAG: hypothetical protein K2L51_07795 [Clostridiales bacterium]|nr:hypothetical protein [Clostridiales bacterium]